MTIAAELVTVFDDAGETLSFADGTTFTGIWHRAANDEDRISGETITVKTLITATSDLAIDDSIYRAGVEYKVRERSADGLNVYETLVVEQQ